MCQLEQGVWSGEINLNLANCATPEVEVTKIILIKDFCQLASPKLRFFSDLRYRTTGL